MGAKNTLPENGLGILEVTLYEELDFLGGRSQIDNGHLAAQAVEGVVARGNDAAGGIEDEFALWIFFETGEDFVEDGDFFSKVLRFTLEVGGAVRPAHPRRNAVDTRIAAGREDRSEASFDLIVATDRGTAESREIFGPVGFARAGHSDESET